ncbi:MAG: hypothetical protein KJN71_08320 [Acidimicrobiia bacterium]|nr:hypothetical protein [Acidimicrobiia bacterium]NNC74771.1 hypothetical protein [Acidimicrobiia bacterium]
MTTFEEATRWSLWFLVAGLVLSIGLLAFGDAGADPFDRFVVHLALLVAFGLALTEVLAPIALDAVYPSLRGAVKGWAGTATTVILVTGVVALVTLASSAALRYQPSAQFLQLLSALDIAWAAAAAHVGARRAWGPAAGRAAGVFIGVFCIWSIWNYVDTVGFAPDGGWQLIGDELMRLVIPYDMVAAVIALALVYIGVRRSTGQPIEQPSDQS